MDAFWHAFIPLFVAFDGVGLLPLYWGLTSRLSVRERRRAGREAVWTALLVVAGFLLVSRFIFALMGLELADVVVAGGAILIVLCVRDLLLQEETPSGTFQRPGVVPIGVPLLAGPAVFTTVLLVKNQVGWPMTMIALGANVACVWGMLRSVDRLMQWLGREGSQVLSRIASLILTAYGVMLIRRGIAQMLG